MLGREFSASEDVVTEVVGTDGGAGRDLEPIDAVCGEDSSSSALRRRPWAPALSPAVGLSRFWTPTGCELR